MRMLLSYGADPLLPNVDGTTPLMAAAGVGFFTDGENPFTADEAAEAVRLLLDLGSDPRAVDADGETALHGAAYRGVNAVVRLLAEHAAADGGWTPWRIAAGVTDIYGLRQKPETAALLRELMEERGLWNDEMEQEARRPK